jgi:RND family efflux transporter MFP subunit
MLKPIGRLAAFLGLAALIAQPVLSAEFTVEPVTVPVMKSVFGQVQSRDLVPARARIGGTIVEIAVEEGDQVETGATIARVVDDKLALGIEALDARMKAVAAQLDNAGVNLDRAKQLFSRGTIAKSRLDELQTQVDVLTNQASAIKADRAVVAQQMSEGDVTAPESGRVLAVPLTEGSVVLPGETVARIAGGGYFLRLLLPERHAAGIKEGDDVLVGQRGLTAESGATAELKGRLAKVYPQIENGRVVADVEVAGLGDFFVGERTLVSIPIGERTILAVPPEAVTTRHGVDYVAILAETGTTEVSVVPGQIHRTDAGPRMEILTGLRSGDTVIVP